MGKIHVILASMVKLFPNLQLFLILSSLSLLIFLLDSQKIFTSVKSFAGFVTNPISFGLYHSKQSFSRQFGFIWEARSAAQQNRALQENIGKLLSENADLKSQLSEAQAQISQNQHLDPKTYKTTTTRPIGLDRYLKIDKGLKDGVKVGQSVAINDNLIGQVVTASQKGAAVRRLVDPDSKVAAFSFGKSGKAKGILIGQFGTDMLMDKILHEEPIEKDELVYSEGTEGVWPRGLILGRVVEVLEKPNEIFKQAKVVPVFDIRDLDLVFVITE